MARRPHACSTSNNSHHVPAVPRYLARGGTTRRPAHTAATPRQAFYFGWAECITKWQMVLAWFAIFLEITRSLLTQGLVDAQLAFRTSGGSSASGGGNATDASDTSDGTGGWWGGGGGGSLGGDADVGGDLGSGVGAFASGADVIGLLDAASNDWRDPTGGCMLHVACCM